MICILLIHRGLFRGAKETLNYFGQRRTDTAISQQFQVKNFTKPAIIIISYKYIVKKPISQWLSTSFDLSFQGVETASQIRYVTYYEKLLSMSCTYPDIVSLKIESIHISGNFKILMMVAIKLFKNFLIKACYSSFQSFCTTF